MLLSLNFINSKLFKNLLNPINPLFSAFWVIFFIDSPLNTLSGITYPIKPKSNEISS